ncbi:MAG TPA: aminotransferase class V-fold PLP-dependent enzyme [Afifellaceae bacterium]|nr:aminotransferase class V-fold PLP-dependent enzyme [Afifellaceae bacterium]
MSGLLPDIDPDGLLEYSVVFTDRSLNSMSQSFQGVMRDISATLKEVYKAHSAIIVPGGGSFAMEAVARQFAGGKTCLVVRNGWFRYRWTQIFEAGNIPERAIVMKAGQTGSEARAPFAPAPIDEVVARIMQEKPDAVFAPHVETASGMILPDDYIRALAEAVHSVGGIMVLDCVASGTVWVDMQALGVDVLVSAPQKGWSSSPCAGLVMLSRKARELIETTTSSSFAMDLKKWLQIMETYENGAHAYHATMPTDALARLRDTMAETREYGFDKVCEDQNELGRRVRALFEEKGFKSVAAEGFQAPSVVVSFTDDPDIQTGKRFAAEGLQVAAGVPLMCDEPEDYRSFRIGLFGLDKLQNIDRTVANLEQALEQLLAKTNTR